MKFSPLPIINESSVLGKGWTGVYKYDIPPELTESLYPQNDTGSIPNRENFETAMLNLIARPQTDSPIIRRAEILYDSSCSDDGRDPIEYSRTVESSSRLDQSEHPRELTVAGFKLKRSIVRRLIPRNSTLDNPISQSCLIMESNDENSALVVQIPHVEAMDSMPFYHPHVEAIGLLFEQTDLLSNCKLSIHYKLPERKSNDSTDRSWYLSPGEKRTRIALHLLESAVRFSRGAARDYQKRIFHDLVVSHAVFQSRYDNLKTKYAREITENWCEDTDPKKHIFEDIAIAAFLIEIWNQQNENGDVSAPTRDGHNEFVDVGCGNGILVYILIREGYSGYGLDHRKRKSWVWIKRLVGHDNILRAETIVPSLIFDSDSSRKKYMSKIELEYPDIVFNSAEFPQTTFLIGNHCDQLTLWMPLLGCPFLALPCCSYNLNGEKTRLSVPRVDMNGSASLLQDKLRQEQEKCQVSNYVGLCQATSKSAYSSLVMYTIYIAEKVGWQVEIEYLRIPSTRNVGILGRNRRHSLNSPQPVTPSELVASLGGGFDWLHNISLINQSTGH